MTIIDQTPTTVIPTQVTFVANDMAAPTAYPQPLGPETEKQYNARNRLALMNNRRRVMRRLAQARHSKGY
jgi:hypothetical protein